MQFRFRLGMRGEAKIEEAYSDPASIVHFITSFVQHGDRIEGATVAGWAWKPLGKPHVTICSGTHNGTVVQISGGCLAQIESPPREHLNSAEIDARNPAITPILRETVSVKID
ncbi:hypothetical protein RugamoR57_28990 [Duganella caerulea]|uniref:hypothetical protein n=1 Tax=Duganella caerulea TaxID=2885762 RepID=UPI0030EAAD10